MYNIFLTGEKNVGKSTIVEKILQSLSSSIGGYSTEFIMKNNLKHFYLTSLSHKGNKTLMAIGDHSIKKIIKIYEYAFNVFGAGLILDSIHTKDVIILDEIGFIENDCDEFKASVIKALDSKKIIIGVLKNYNGEFINYIKDRKDVILFNINEENREEIPKIIIDMIRNKQCII
ncbi:nucleoside-triphosphatase [Clostridium sp. MSJ-11]|uniref:Nucleoside-triphosphatase n=1 Tax=Clostridium mobile TaxID=2841512 RepID=A0ABS6EHN4_9CLOT|nr:nucleoside-triphosphatase [Clostridium mobile]MBU5484712.1 nucleoside-triphosphatase [Clostridium mobile]